MNCFYSSQKYNVISLNHSKYVKLIHTNKTMFMG